MKLFGPSQCRITFTDISADSVTWRLAVSPDQGETWTTLWIMEMRRTEKQRP